MLKRSEAGPEMMCRNAVLKMHSYAVLLRGRLCLGKTFRGRDFANTAFHTQVDSRDAVSHLFQSCFHWLSGQRFVFIFHYCLCHFRQSVKGPCASYYISLTPFPPRQFWGCLEPGRQLETVFLVLTGKELAPSWENLFQFGTNTLLV